MSYRGSRNWPPTWVWLDGAEEKRPKGEIGFLRTVLLSKMQCCDRCFLLIFYEGSPYLGCLLFDDEMFCNQITKLLQRCSNLPIAEIGSLDLSHML
jgi:hypothetical protein